MLTEGFASANIDPNRTVVPDGEGTYTEPEPTATSQASASSPDTPETPQPTGDDGEPTAPAAPVVQASSDQPAGEPPADPDLDLSTLAPFTYQTADGRQGSIEGVYRTDDGLLVPKESEPQIERLAIERDQFAAQIRELEAQRATVERLTAWNTYDRQGNVTNTVTGVPGLEQRALLMRRTLAAAQTMGQIFDDPEKLASLVSAQLGQDGQVYLVPNTQAIESLKVSVKAAALEAELAERQQFQRASAPPAPAEPSVESRALPTVERTIKSLNVQGLTDQDKQYLASHVGRFLRPATPDEQRQGLGKMVMHEDWARFVTDRAEMRATAAKAAKASEQAGKFNAGMNQRKPQPAVPPKAAPVAPPPTGTKPTSKAAAWDSIFQTAMSEISQSNP